ncbi:MAG TPA: PKD domain-containing protein [Brumimicrobium sp.]|nr:PKD domain-containing protein [Brumimicrobium sp.]
MKHLLLVLTILLISPFVMATHIVGGSLTYEHLGGTTYSVKLKLYRDCGDPNNAAFPDSAKVIVYDGLGGLTNHEFTMPRMGIISLNPPIDPCAVNPGVCVQETVYTSIVSLPPSVGGYHLHWSTCCRNNSLGNIHLPGNAGESFHTYIPNTLSLLTNSSPNWVNFPPVFVCMGQDINFDHSATDANGDSLVYSLYTPYDEDAPSFDNTLSVPDNIAFTPVVWAPGYSLGNPLNSTTNLIAVNPQTGLLSGIPSNIGQFVIGIRCEEYRNGVKIGEIVRDFQLNVVACPPAKDAAIGPITGCAGTSVQMINASAAGASDFEWDFGDGSPISTSFEPSHTYTSIGDYTITLIAQRGTVCADTATYLLRTGGVTAVLDNLAPTCISNAANFVENSTTTGNMVVNSWQWDFNDGTPIRNIPNPSHIFANAGTLNVKLIVGTDAGCYDTIIKPINVQGLPVADVGPDTTACFNNPNISLNGIVTNATGGVWIGNGGTFNPNTTDLNANYDPSPLEIATGSTNVTLSTTGNGLCPSTQSTLNIRFIDGPNIDAGPDIEVCEDIGSVPLTVNFQYAGGVEWYTMNGTGTFSDPLIANPEYTPSAADIAADSVELIVHTTINGNCFDASDTLWVKFFSSPSISLDYIDTVCANNPILLDANSTTGSGIWTTNGDGTFDNSTSNVTSYTHGPADLAFGNVEIYFESTLNGGCQIQHDTINIRILPSPVVDYSFTEVCNGLPTEFSSSVTSTDPITSYSWSANGTEFSTLESPEFIIPNTDTNNVVFIAYSQNGCSDTISKPVMTFHLPMVNFNIPSPCLNGGTQYYDSSYVIGGNIDTWEWNFGDGELSTEENPLHYYSNAADFNVQLIVTSTEGCVDSLTETTTIYPGPSAAFSATPLSAYVYQDINFVDQSTSDFPLVFWEWDFNDGNISNDQNTNHNYNNGGSYEVLLSVEDEHGCLDTATNAVNIFLPPNVPSAFSPNGDGNNDLLYVYGGPYKTLEFKVYNNWGEVIFTTNDATIGWDGTYKGVEQPVGVYIWTVKATTSNNEKHELSGDTSLIK